MIDLPLTVAACSKSLWNSSKKRKSLWNCGIPPLINDETGQCGIADQCPVWLVLFGRDRLSVIAWGVRRGCEPATPCLAGEHGRCLPRLRAYHVGAFVAISPMATRTPWPQLTKTSNARSHEVYIVHMIGCVLNCVFCFKSWQGTSKKNFVWTRNQTSVRSNWSMRKRRTIWHDTYHLRFTFHNAPCSQHCEREREGST